MSFTLIGAMAVVSAFLAWFLMSMSERQTQKILTKTLPVVSGSQTLGQEIILFTVISRDLPKLATREQHQRLQILLQERIQGIHKRLNDLESLGVEEEQLQVMRSRITLLEENLEQQDALAVGFLDAREKLVEAVLRLQKKLGEFTAIIQPRLAQSYKDFKRDGQDIKEDISDTIKSGGAVDNTKKLNNLFRVGFDTMVSTAIGEIRANHEIIAATFQGFGFMQEAANVDTIERVEELYLQFEELLPAYRRLRLILANTTPENNRVLLTAIPVIQSGMGEESIFQLRVDELRARLEASRYSIQAMEIVEGFTEQVRTFTDASRETAKLDALALNRTISRAQLIHFLVVIAVVLVCVFIGWYYVGHRLVSRITQLKEAMDEHASGRDVKIPLHGNDEISDMAHALQSFVHQRGTVEAALRQSLESLNEAQLIANFGSCRWDKNGGVWEWSDSFYRIIGYYPEEIASTEKNFWAHVFPADREKVFHFFAQSLPSSKIFEIEFRLLTKGDTIRTVATRWRYTRAGNIIMNTLHGTIFDITERQQIEEELHKVKKLESIGVLAGGIAHDFNNLLTVIMGNVSLAINVIPEEHTVQNHLRLLESAANRARDLTKRLLTFAKGGEPVRSVSSLRSILLESVEFTLHGSNVKCEFNIPESLWVVDVDASQMGQVFQNLVVNANQAMPGGGSISITCENITIEKDESLNLLSGNYIKIDIADNGCGMPQESLTNIFDPYFTTKAMDSSKGSGLGLAIVHSIVLKHGGAVDVRSLSGKGTTFSVYIPALPDVDVLPLNIKSTAIPFPGLILVMDDEEMIREVLESLLDHLGCDVLVAKDGSEAVDIYKEYYDKGQKPDLVIMDLTIPGGMGGQEAAKLVLAIDPLAKIIVSSGYSDDHVIENYKDYGFCALVSKPYQIDELTEILSTTMGKDIVEISGGS